MIYLLSTCILVTNAAIVGQISIDNTVIQATQVTYSFQLSFQKQIPQDGRLLIRFPVEFASQSSSPPQSCTISSQNTPCSYNKAARILTIPGSQLLSSATQLQIRILGVTNYDTAKTSGNFQINSYSKNGTDFLLMENSITGFKVTTTAGSIQSKSYLSLSDPTVGLFSILTVKFNPDHAIPKDGQILMQFPKWNQFDPTVSYFESMVAVPTSPSQIDCSQSHGILKKPICIFTQGTTQDSLVIYLNEDVNVLPQSNWVAVLLGGVRAPPSQQPVTGFTLATADNNGILIDEVKNPSSITLQATIPVQSSIQSLRVLPVPTTVNAISNMTLIVQNFNPLATGATIKITFPSEFKINLGPINVVSSGVQLDPNPIFNLQQTTRTLTIQRFNTKYLEEYQQSYFYITGIGNPSQTDKTSSFKLEILDSDMLMIEHVDSGITFQATTGGFIAVSLQADNSYINSVGVSYTFTLQPEDSFTSSAVLKLTFPDEIQISSTSTIKSLSQNMNANTASLTVNYNKELLIKNAFPNGYTQFDVIKFTLVGITNPRFTERTHGIQLMVYYESNSGIGQIVDIYTGNGLSFQADPSPFVTIAVIMSSNGTGETNQVLNITGTIPNNMYIEQGSSLKVLIPAQFSIADPVRVASSCTKVTGFSDEISCSFESISPTEGAVLKVVGGFGSNKFSGGSFTFHISEVKNPFTTQRTDAFGLSVYDLNGYPLYVPQQRNFTTQVSASNFAFSFVSSSSPINGVSSMYQFSVTMSVDTKIGTQIQIDFPSEIKFDNSKLFSCIGTMGLSKQLICNQISSQQVIINLSPQDSNIKLFKNGTTLNFQIGYFFNSISLKTTGTFMLQSFDFDKNNQKFWINKILSGLPIMNTQRGKITVQNITQIGSKELNANTQLQIQIQTQNAIPQNSILTIMVPNNFVLSTSVSVTINNVVVTATIDASTYTIRCALLDDGLKNYNLIIKSGLQNPSQGPYIYQGFNFEINSAQGFAIDAALSMEIWTKVQCNNYCSLCQNTLNGCLACGADIYGGQVSYLSGMVCVKDCPSGFYGGPGYKCQKCTGACLECQYAGDLCTKCDPAFGKPYANLVSLQCQNECPSGTYLNKELSQCLPCKSPCYTCTSETQCLSCEHSTQNQTLYFFQNKCLSECPAVSVPSPSKVCVDCEAPCKTCTEMPEKCTSCTGGLFVYKHLCVDSCPFNYYKDQSTMECKSLASLDIPFPFTILALLFSILMGISHCMKNGKGDSQGTTFFISVLAFVDLLLRINWFILGVISLQLQYYGSGGWCAVILFTSCALNLAIWRRFFKFKYNMDENDRNFVTYCQNYPKTSRWIIFLSYSFSFQAIRLSYSRLLGKKQFMASFTRKKKYYRLIGQCSILEIFFVFIPAIALNIYDLFMYQKSQQIFFIGIDSLILISYATILISITLAQREKVLNPDDLFKWSELFRFNVQSDEEDMYENDVMAGFKDDSYRVPITAETVQFNDVLSEKRLKEIKSSRRKLYQTELRAPQWEKYVDYNEQRRLEEKLSRVQLKKSLYENQRDSDYIKVQDLSGNVHAAITERDKLRALIEKLKRELKLIQNKILKAQNDKPPIMPDMRIIRRYTIQPVVEDFPPVVPQPKKSKSQSRKQPKFYFDKFSRKVFYDNKEGVEKVLMSTSSDLGGSQQFVRKGTLKFKQLQGFQATPPGPTPPEAESDRT